MNLKQTTTKTTGSGATNGLVPHHVEPKLIVAVVLVALMAVLWGRVLFRSKAGPASAEAASAAAEEIQQDSNPEIRIQPAPLAIVAGRHDAIETDFFRADRYLKNTGGEQAVVDKDAKSKEDQRILDAVEKSISLEAVIKNAQGKAEKACISGTVVGIGAVFHVQVQDNKYAVRVEGIDPGGVQLNWQGHTFTLKLPD